MARAIESAEPEKLDERAALLAHHCEEAGDPLAAARWYERAAEYVRRTDPAECLRLWRKVRELAATLPEEETRHLRAESCLKILNVGGWRLGLTDAEVTDGVLAGISPVGVELRILSIARYVTEVIEGLFDLGATKAGDEGLDALPFFALRLPQGDELVDELGHPLGGEGTNREAVGATVVGPLATDHELEVRHSPPFDDA